MIIFGSGNYYKRDSVYRADICENCGSFQHLHSYTCTPAGHVYWVPIIPLGSKRIMDQCPSCKAGREMSLGKWKKLRREEVIPALEELHKDPSNRDVAERALGLVRQFGTPEEFNEAMEVIWPHYSNDPEMLAKLGWGMSRFHHRDEAMQMLDASLAIKEDPEIRELKEFLESAPRTSPPSPPNRILQLMPFLIIPIAILTVFGAIVFSGTSKKPGHVYLANGLTKPYSVMVSGEQVEIGAKNHRKLRVDYGPVSITPVPGAEYGFPFEPIELDLTAEFWKRVSGGNVVVFNPDRTGLFSYQEIVYFPEDIRVATDEMMESGSMSLYAGKEMHEFRKPDYVFREPPENIKMSGSRLTKTAVQFYPELDPSAIVSALLDEGDHAQASEYLYAQLKAEPERQASALLPILSLVGSPEEVVEFIEDRLDDRPLLIEWHRYYQELKPTVDPSHNLLAEYQDRLAKNPENSDLTYLTARQLPDGAEQQAMFLKSTQMSPPSAYGFYALAYDDWARAKFGDALSNLRKAIELKPGELTFQSMEYDFLAANGKWDELATMAQADFEADPSNFTNAQYYVTILAANGEESKTTGVITQYIEIQNEGFDMPDQMGQQLLDLFESSIAIGKHQRERYAEAAKKIGSPIWDFQASLCEGDIAAAESALENAAASAEDGYVPTDHRLILYAAATAKGKRSVAEKQLTLIRDDFASNKEGFGAWIQEGAEIPTLEDLINDSSSRGYRNVAGVILAMRSKDNTERAEFLEYAKRMNYNFDFRTLVLDWIFEEIE